MQHPQPRPILVAQGSLEAVDEANILHKMCVWAFASRMVAKW